MGISTFLNYYYYYYYFFHIIIFIIGLHNTDEWICPVLFLSQDKMCPLPLVLSIRL